MSDMGAMPVYEVGNNRNYSDFANGGGTWIWVFFLFFLLAWGGGNGFGFGNNVSAATQGALTRAELYDGFNNQNVVRKLDGLENGLCDGFYAMNTGMLNGFGNLTNQMTQQTNAINGGINNLGYQIQSAACETNRNIDSLKYEGQINTTNITNAIHCEAEMTRALINQNTVQELRDRLEARDRDLLAANFQISQQLQTAQLVDTLQPVSRPAYITCSPYASHSCCNGCYN